MRHISSVTAGRRRLIARHKSQVIFHKRATNYRALLRKMTCKVKTSYGSSPPCIARDVSAVIHRGSWQSRFPEIPGHHMVIWRLTQSICRTLSKTAIFVDFQCTAKATSFQSSLCFFWARHPIENSVLEINNVTNVSTVLQESTASERVLAHDCFQSSILSSS